jgi:hypothetical protein
MAIAAKYTPQPSRAVSWLVRATKLGQRDSGTEDLCCQPRLMNEALVEIARHHAYGSLGLEHDPELAFAGVRALRSPVSPCGARRRP